jgi:hypothetical protein
MEGEEGEWARSITANYGKPEISLPWIFKVDTHEDKLLSGFRLENVLADHYFLFQDPQRQHTFDCLSTSEREYRLERIVHGFNALKSPITQFVLSDAYYERAYKTAGDLFLDGILEWTVKYEDWEKK